MDSEVQPPEPPPSPPVGGVRSRPSSWSSSGSSGGVEYTSLRDVLAESGTTGSWSGGGSGSAGDAAHVIDFDASSITIRNQLLKHAASAYLQSAIVVAPRDRGCWQRLLQRRRCRILMRPCACTCLWPWSPGCGSGAGDPAHRCAASVAASARRLVAFLSGCVACMWT